MDETTVGILGSGDVGKQLGRGFAHRGHDVMIGSRGPNSHDLEAWMEETGRRSTGSFAKAAEHGDVVVLALLGSALEDVLVDVGPAVFADKLVIDATNPLAFHDDDPPGLFVGTTDSLGERVQRNLPEARVVKCFNTVSNVQMVEPDFDEGTPEMMICGEDAQAKKEVESLLLDFGWPGALDVGGIEAARWLEALVPLWVRLGSNMGTYEHAFKVVR